MYDFFLFPDERLIPAETAVDALCHVDDEEVRQKYHILVSLKLILFHFLGLRGPWFPPDHEGRALHVPA